MKDILLHTPEGTGYLRSRGVPERQSLEKMLAQVLSMYGYQRIQTPAFEFLIYLTGIEGTVKSREMYKFFDREGNTLVLRQI